MLIFSAENRHNIHVVLYIGLISKGGGAVMTKTTPAGAKQPAYQPIGG